MIKKLLYMSGMALTIAASLFVFSGTCLAKNVVTTNFSDNFSSFDSGVWNKSDWANGSPFNCIWRPSQVSVGNNEMDLTLDKDDTGSAYPYKSGEYRTNSFFGHGYFEVKMKPVKNTGIVSSFFTYTGSSNNDPWDEIDIEFLGKDTSKVQFNWYTNGTGGHEYLYNLGFDASSDFHVYGFDWQQDRIDYYVDGVKVYTGRQSIPVTSAQIMMNLWPCKGIDSWTGAYDGKTPLKAQYKYVKYYPGGFSSSNVTPTPTPTRTPTPTPTPTRTPTNTPTPTPLVKNVVTTNFSDSFSSFNESTWMKSDWANGSPFDCIWKPSQVSVGNNEMDLTLERDDTGSAYPYKSGEYRTNSFFGHGYYEVKMKAVKNIGVVSSFFTYTGSSNNDPWDEIDIEFLGKDTSKVQFNWYTNGTGGHEYLYNLGFDASSDFHVYGFDWQQDRIDYYVDGVKVYTGRQSIPVTTAQIMMNLWPCKGIDSWTGAYDGKTPLKAQYKYVKYFPGGFQNSTTVKGDVDGNGVLNSTDYSLEKRYLLGMTVNLPNGTAALDVNGDGKINSTDLSLIKRYLLGMAS